MLELHGQGRGGHSRHPPPTCEIKLHPLVVGSSRARSCPAKGQSPPSPSYRDVKTEIGGTHSKSTYKSIFKNSIVIVIFVIMPLSSNVSLNKGSFDANHQCSFYCIDSVTDKKNPHLVTVILSCKRYPLVRKPKKLRVYRTCHSYGTPLSTVAVIFIDKMSPYQFVWLLLCKWFHVFKTSKRRYGYKRYRTYCSPLLTTLGTYPGVSIRTANRARRSGPISAIFRPNTSPKVTRISGWWQPTLPDPGTGVASLQPRRLHTVRQHTVHLSIQSIVLYPLRISGYGGE